MKINNISNSQNNSPNFKSQGLDIGTKALNAFIKSQEKEQR